MPPVVPARIGISDLPEPSPSHPLPLTLALSALSSDRHTLAGKYNAADFSSLAGSEQPRPGVHLEFQALVAQEAAFSTRGNGQVLTLPWQLQRIEDFVVEIRWSGTAPSDPSRHKFPPKEISAAAEHLLGNINQMFT